MSAWSFPAYASMGSMLVERISTRSLAEQLRELRPAGSSISQPLVSIGLDSNERFGIRRSSSVPAEPAQFCLTGGRASRSWGT